MADDPKKEKPPLQAEKETATGIGGLRRRRKIDELVDEALQGKQRDAQTTDSNN